MTTNNNTITRTIFCEDCGWAMPGYELDAFDNDEFDLLKSGDVIIATYVCDDCGAEVTDTYVISKKDIMSA